MELLYRPLSDEARAAQVLKAAEIVGSVRAFLPFLLPARTASVIEEKWDQFFKNAGGSEEKVITDAVNLFLDSLEGLQRSVSPDAAFAANRHEIKTYGEAVRELYSTLTKNNAEVVGAVLMSIHDHFTLPPAVGLAGVPIPPVAVPLAGVPVPPAGILVGVPLPQAGFPVPWPAAVAVRDPPLLVPTFIPAVPPTLIDAPPPPE